MLKDRKVEELILELSSNSPAPGGGTVSGLAGALSSAMISMVCNLTIGKKRYRQHEDDIKKNLDEAKKLSEEFVLLSDKDAEVFSEVMDAYSMPRMTEEEKNERKKAIEETTKRAALVPMDVLRRCELAAKLSLSVALKGNENSISDAGVAAIMAYASAQGASLNILINLSTISDEDFIGKLKTEQANVLKAVHVLFDETMQIVKSKL